MKYLKTFVMYNESKLENETFSGVIPKNYKQENALLSNINRGEISREYEYNPKGDTEYTRKIHDFLSSIKFNDDSYRDRFYFMNRIPSGEVRGYKNTSISGVSISSENAVTFHIHFDVENPHIEEIKNLERDLERFRNIQGEDEWAKVEDEWESIYDRKRKLDSYIANFTFAYSQSVDDNIIKLVFDEMNKPQNIQKSEHIANLRSKLQKARFKIESLPYKDKLDYWDWMDELEDLTDYKTPSEKEMAERKKRREITEEEYNRQQEEFSNLLDDID